MLSSDTSYPVKLVSRKVTRVRTRKIRATWLAVGVAFGLGCTSALSPKFNEASIEIAKNVEEKLPELPAIIASGRDNVLEAIIGASPNLETKTVASLDENTIYPVSLNLKVERGDSFISLMTDAGIGYDEANNLSESVRSVFNPRRLDVGSTVTVEIDKNANGDKIIRSMRLPVSTLSTIEVARASDDSFSVKKVDAPVFKKLAHAGGTIDSSLYQTAADAGMPPALINEIINAYSYDVDFQREIKDGNKIDALFERLETKDGTVAGNGNLIYAELELADRRLKIYRYTASDGTADFYNEKGESIRKALLRTPINGAKITSGYGMRNHPLLGYTRMHKGVDFGAPIGTPIYAAGDGVVESASVKNGYGNYLKIKHNSQYSSAYAHLSRFASGVSPGKRVKQGQIVGYVGMTGMTSGPHLHYEILSHNEQVNPANVKFKNGNVLTGKELLAFKSNISKIESRLASIGQGNTVAMVDSDKDFVAN